MIKNLKYRLSAAFGGWKLRAYCAVIMALITFAATTLLDTSVNTVKVYDGEQTYVTRTLSPNVATVLASLNLKSESYNVVSAVNDEDTTTINIEYTFPVFITNSGSAKKVSVPECTVAEALAAAGFSVDEHDIVEPSLDTVLTETAYIDYINVDYVSTDLTKEVPFKTNTVYSRNYNQGTTKTLTKGENGSERVTYTSKVVNGEVISSKVTNVVTLSNVVDEVKVVGTKKKGVKTSEDVNDISTLKAPFTIELDENGAPVKYKSMRKARATAYTYTGNRCSTGVAPQPGYIAVNPKVIPYGTKMYIKTSDGSYIYGYAVAADTGGFINNYPTGVDLFMTSESACRRFGVRTVEIYILG
ncbi:MAG: DUF348 domain-containing protein [Clostridia bacterium]|nr:DUF348 domain-containing protein [Clostridia bacterium]